MSGYDIDINTRSAQKKGAEVVFFFFPWWPLNPPILFLIEIEKKRGGGEKFLIPVSDAYFRLG